MSQQMSNTGFYGKLPSHGDFVSRFLPRDFVGPWDQWLQASILASREQLGQAWLDAYLVSPLWQFALAAGVCGNDAWVGVLMPSVDKVGRYFPLTVAAKTTNNRLHEVFSPDCQWFDEISALALSALDGDFDFEKFNGQLSGLNLINDCSGPITQQGVVGSCSQNGCKAYRFELALEANTLSAIASLPPQFLNQATIWRTFLSENAPPVLLACEGLPPINVYAGFLNQVWPQRGWDFSVIPVSGKPVAVDSQTANLADDTIPFMRLQTGAETNDNAATMASPRTLPTVSSLVWQSCAISVVGLRRKINEDAILDRCDARLWAVADGMGGHSAGDVASQALVAALAEVPFNDDLADFSRQVEASLHQVNINLLQLAQQRGHGQIIGSTIVVLLIAGNQFRYLWAGDSRLYRYRHDKLEQLTLDHSLYNEAIRLGLPPSDGSLEQGRGNVITRAIGAELNLQVESGQGEVEVGDLFLLCSDGLDKELAHHEIAAFCQTGSPSGIAQRLITEAERRGGRDNISVIVVQAAF